MVPLEFDFRLDSRRLLEIGCGGPLVKRTVRNHVRHATAGEAAYESQDCDGCSNFHAAPGKTNL
jgi:hypothetical protein